MTWGPGFSAALCRGLIEARALDLSRRRVRACFPRLYVAASLKHLIFLLRELAPGSFPRLYVAASLKPVSAGPISPPPRPFSAALCRGLIEARRIWWRWWTAMRVFRGFMSRPH